MKRTTRLLVLLLATVCIGACASTRFVSTWKDPGAVFGALDGQKIAAFLISDNESTRRSAEDALARELTARGARGFAGHSLMSTEEAKDQATAERKLEEAGIEAVITMRVVSEDEQITETPGSWYQVPYYRNWGGYWHVGWRTVYEPGYVRHDTVARVEFLIYAMDTKKLIWASLSDTTNPGDIDSFVHELARAVDGAIKKSQLLS